MMSEKMFVIGVFFFGCSLGYCLFEILSTTIKKTKSTDFFLILVKNMTQAIDVITKQL